MDDSNAREEANRVIDVLKMEFLDKRQELLFHEEVYHRQITYSYVFFSAVAALAGIINALGQDAGGLPLTLRLFSEPSTRFSAGVVFVSISTVFLLYFVSSTMEALYMIRALGARIAQIEEGINLYLEQDVLIWDSKLVGRLLGASPLLYRGWIRPPVLQTLWTMFIVLGLTTTVCASSLVLLPEYRMIPIVIVVLTLFHMFQHYRLLSVGPRYIESIFREFPVRLHRMGAKTSRPELKTKNVSVDHQDIVES